MMERRYRAKQAEKAAREAEDMAEEFPEDEGSFEQDESNVPECVGGGDIDAENSDVEVDGEDKAETAEAKYTEENTDIKED